MVYVNELLTICKFQKGGNMVIKVELIPNPKMLQTIMPLIDATGLHLRGKIFSFS